MPLPDITRTAFDQAIDQAHLRGTLADAIDELRRIDLYLRPQVEKARHFVAQDCLPSETRAAYSRLLSQLQPVVLAATQAREACKEYPHNLLHTRMEAVPLPDGWLAQAERAIEQINAAEREMDNQCRAAQATLLAEHGNGIFDWRNGFRFTIRLLLHAPATRPCYDETAEANESLYEELFITTSNYHPIPTDEEISNWNPWQYSPAHPLAHLHMEYLAHVLLDHEQLPWQLLPLVKEVSVELEFNDCQTLWPVDKRDTCHHI